MTETRCATTEALNTQQGVWDAESAHENAIVELQIEVFDGVPDSLMQIIWSKSANDKQFAAELNGWFEDHLNKRIAMENEPL